MDAKEHTRLMRQAEMPMKHPPYRQNNDELEAVVENDVVDFAQRRGWLVRKLKYIGRRNAADRLFVRAGRVVFVEFKRPGGEPPRPGQEREIARLKAHGAEVYVIDNREDGYAVFA